MYLCPVMKQKEHLPFFGIGPYYVAAIAILTVVGILLSCKGYLDSGIIPALKMFICHRRISVRRESLALGAAFYLLGTDGLDDEADEGEMAPRTLWCRVRSLLQASLPNLALVSQEMRCPIEDGR